MVESGSVPEGGYRNPGFAAKEYVLAWFAKYQEEDWRVSRNLHY
jgi:hypothetical protein